MYDYFPKKVNLFMNFSQLIQSILAALKLIVRCQIVMVIGLTLV